MFLKNIVSYSGASLIVQAAQVAQGFIVRRVLPPELLGAWNYVGVTQSFVGTFDTGITQGAGRELPLLRGAGRTDEEDLARCTAFWARLGQAGLFAAGIVVYFWWFGSVSPHASLIAWSAAALVLLSSCNESLVVFFQSSQRYVVLGRASSVGALASAAFLPLGAWWNGLDGLIWGAIAAMALQFAQLLWYGRREGLPLHARFSWPALWRLMGFGLPMRVVDYPLALFTILDVLVVSRFMTAAELALYTTAKIMTTMAIDVPSRMGNVYLSRLYIQCGANADRRRLGAEMARFLNIQYLLVMPLVICGACTFAAVIIPLYIPQYASSLKVAPALLLLTYFVPQTSLVRNFWMIDKRFAALGLANAAGLVAVAGALALAVAWRGFTLEAVAWGMVTGHAIYYLVLIGTVGRSVWGGRGALGVAAAAFAACIWTGLVIRFLELGRLHTGGVSAILGNTSVQLGTALLCLLPLLLMGWLRGRVWEFFPRGGASQTT